MRACHLIQELDGGDEDDGGGGGGGGHLVQSVGKVFKDDKNCVPAIEQDYFDEAMTQMVAGPSVTACSYCTSVPAHTRRIAQGLPCLCVSFIL